MAGGLSPASQGNAATRLGINLRRLADRVARLERNTNVVVGGWRLREVNGQLVAQHPATGTQVVLATHP